MRLIDADDLKEAIAKAGHFFTKEQKRPLEILIDNRTTINAVVLPCEVGDTVYTNFSMQGDFLRKKARPYAVKVCYIEFNEKYGAMNVIYSTGRMWRFRFDEIGKTVFLTKHEAQQALKEREIK